MRKDDVSDDRSLSLRKTNVILVGIALLVSVVFFVASFRMIKNYSDVKTTTSDYVKWNQNAYEMKTASDYLTEQVRLFVVTGESQYMNRYFDEVNTSKRRDRALSALGDALAGTEAYHSLSLAMDESISLMDQEYYAMRLVCDALDLSSSGLPGPVQRIVLKDADEALSADEKRELAREYVFGNEYQESRDNIFSQVDNCISKLAEIKESELNSSSTRMRSTLILQQILSVLFVAIILTVVLFTSIQVINPLLRAIPNIRENRPLPIQGAHEFRFLAKTYNHLYEITQEHKEQLDFKASHDELTNLYNRRGFQKVRGVDLSTSALLIIDADHFKGINDTYGHNVGDRILKKIADSITAQFRSDDYVFRLGGDEFAVLMLNTGSSQKPQIYEKIKHINEILQDSSDGLPQTSVSAGAAFGTNDDDMESLYKKADRALYSVKEAGRCDCAFYQKV